MVLKLTDGKKGAYTCWVCYVTKLHITFSMISDEKKRRQKKHYIPGLTNIGNSCFLNALVQAFASCPLFINWLALKLTKSSPDLASSLHKLLKVLNNDGGHGGDACAGEVLMALRGQGWVISTDEQDTHELFHVLTATLDDELMSGEDIPSLLDVSWVEKTSLYGDQKQRKANGIMCKINFNKSCCEDNFKKYEEETNYKVPKVNESAIGETHLKYHIENHANQVISTEDSFINKEIINTQTKNDRLVCNGISSCNKIENTYKPKKSNDRFLEKSHILDSNLNLSNIKMSRLENEEKNPNINKKIFSKTHMNCINKENNKNTKEIYFSENLFKKEKIRGECNWIAYSENYDNPFRGYLASQLQCTACAHKNPAQWSSFESISLSLPKVSWGDMTLQDLLHTYITHEKVSDVTCDNCSKISGRDAKTIFTKRLTIGKLPECLCFHIKRTVWMDNGTAVKRRDHVTFSEFLIMDPFTYTTSITSQQTNYSQIRAKEAPVITTKDSTISARDSNLPCFKENPSKTLMSQNASSTLEGRSD
ncbi:unnamed protein product, partial [Meganyctiphanes norvegica]